ncbi:MAG: YggS family pyridoxal phosphate-dependent enzyme [Flavobacteriales bacterium]|nr:YggS family pyridoxal phosphate-dependent enzyme [Flavobacteriales bacterium]MBK7481744.1 YggS family pyridoxal phosphate-dependent enzyme [Flavobacteriales bacterium]MBP8878010.1 YggS family pyridoxal phosphate-dependent enzyme [Flavobacteriales bacterium]
MAIVDHSALAVRYATVKASLPDHITLVAVSKTRSVEEIQALYDLGHRDFGENYPQELREKVPLLPPDIRWHFIGHLQRSNVKHVLPVCHLIHGVDSPKLMDEMEKRAKALQRNVSILLQVHIGQETTKHGFTEEELKQFTFGSPDPIERWPHCTIRGLMGMATNTSDPDQIAREFRNLNDWHQAIRTHGPFPLEQFTVLSIGMSSDVDIAVKSGTTMVRIGTAIFGERA